MKRDGVPVCLLGLIGRGIQESKSPAIHETEAAEQGFRCSYELMDLDAHADAQNVLPGLLRSAEQRGFAGLNITYPCKQAIIPMLDHLSDEARAIGAVNTVRFSAGRRIGYNTDAWGFAESFRRGLPGASLDRVVQVGAGGAGAATAHALLELGTMELLVVDANDNRAQQLATKLAKHFSKSDVKVVADVARAVATADGVVNATPMGMATHPGSAIPTSLLRPNQWVADIVYFPLETQLLRDARTAGCRTLDGGGMVVFQAARAFEIFTGRKADCERMRRHFATLAEP
jgi:quinate/shikimate dehydrogenase (NAD+)